MKIALIGYGKMGKTIEGIAVEEGDEIMLRISSGNLDELTAENLRPADVAIEFSTPDAAFSNIRLCLAAGVPVVSGTTAWLDKMAEARALCEKHGGALIYASNFSIGVNLFFALNRYLAELMASQGQYGAGMEEIHHTQKLDAPSGTAITLAEDILKRLDRKKSWVNEKTDKPEQLSILSKREGQVPGTHIVEYHSPEDTISIRHEAHSREGFARGALQAARWLVGRKGCFEMKDMLGF